MERAAILSGDSITVADLPEDPHESPFDDEAGEPDSAGTPPPPPLATPGGARATLREYRDAAERAYIVDVLKELEWNISRASVTLGVERTNLHKKIRAYGIKRGEG